MGNIFRKQKKISNEYKYFGHRTFDEITYNHIYTYFIQTNQENLKYNFQFKEILFGKIFTIKVLGNGKDISIYLDGIHLSEIKQNIKLFKCDVVPSYKDKIYDGCCSVCLNEFNEKPDIQYLEGNLCNNDISILSCGHIFHKPCINQVIKSGMYKCPLCRQPFNDLNETLSLV